MKTTGSNDSSASVRCTKHGRRVGGIFFRPEPNEGVPADYMCLHCWIEAGKPQQITREQFYRLQLAR